MKRPAGGSFSFTRQRLGPLGPAPVHAAGVGTGGMPGAEAAQLVVLALGDGRGSPKMEKENGISFTGKITGFVS